MLYLLLKLVAILVVLFLFLFIKKFFDDKNTEKNFWKAAAQVIVTVITVIGVTLAAYWQFRNANYNDTKTAKERLKSVVENWGDDSKTKSNHDSGELNSTDDDLNLEVALIYSENPEGSSNVNAAIAAVINNRIESSNFKNDIKSVIFEENQFSSVVNGYLADYSSIPEINANQIKSDIAKSTNDQTNGCLYFYKKTIKSDQENAWILSGDFGAVEIDGYIFLKVFPY